MPKEAWGRDLAQQTAEFLPEDGSTAAFGNLLHVSVDDYGHRHCLAVLFDLSAVFLVNGILERPSRLVDFCALTRNLQCAFDSVRSHLIRALADRNDEIEAATPLRLLGRPRLRPAIQQHEGCN